MAATRSVSRSPSATSAACSGDSGGLWSDVKSVFSSVGNFFDNIFGGIGDFFSSIFPVALDLNGDGVQLTPVTSSNTFFDMAGDGYQHLNHHGGQGCPRKALM
jgi:hypothetical protein